jgi:N-acetyl-gamma-glutamyl-phosphate reductase
VNKLPVGVLGASGYAGRELCALVARHPGLELAFATANERRGERARIGGTDITFLAADDAPLHEAALVFSALPHGASSAWVARAREAGARVVDLSADLRPGNGDPRGSALAVAARAHATANRERTAATSDNGTAAAAATTALLADTVPYGLTELARAALPGAEVVANPGCYPTAILLALAPLLERGLIPAGASVSISAASGVTGAGFTPRHDLLFGEVTEDFRAYGVGNTHRHLAEMTATVEALGGDCDLVFTPHLLPVARGILATITVPVDSPPADPLALFAERYAGEACVEVTPELPALKDVVRRNVVRLTARPVAGVRRPTLLVIAAIDNLVKGAAGQAVQNANVMLGLPETAGLPL